MGVVTSSDFYTCLLPVPTGVPQSKQHPSAPMTPVKGFGKSVYGGGVVETTGTVFGARTDPPGDQIGP